MDSPFSYTNSILKSVHDDDVYGIGGTNFFDEKHGQERDIFS